MLYRLGILSLLLSFVLTSSGQNITMDDMVVDANQCSGNIFDSGGEFGFYQNNQDVTVTICSDILGEGIVLDFLNFNVEDGFDFLTIYDGPDDTSPQVPGSPFTGTTINQIFATGSCLTLNFTSDGSNVDAGWWATINCAPVVVMDPCLISYTTDVQPAPVAGECYGDTTYTICLSITDWDVAAPNAFHGFSIDLGPAWDPASIVPISAANSCNGLGTWDFYPTVTSTGSGTMFGPGFYYDDGDGDPGNNAGDACAGALPWDFCFEATMAPCTSFPDGEDAGVTLNTYSDGESGMFNDPSCSGDDIIVLAQTGTCAPCLVPPSVTMGTSDSFCPDEYPVPLTFDFTGTPPFTVNFTAGGVPATFTTNLFSDFTMVGSGTYELVSVSDATCNEEPAAGTVIYDLLPVPTIALESDTAFCIGQSVDLTVTFTGTAPFNFEYSIGGILQPQVTSFTDTYIINATLPGLYQIESFSDSGCNGDPPFASVTVTEVIAPSITFLSGGTICPGEMTDITALLAGTPPQEITFFLDGVFYDQVTNNSAGITTFSVTEPGIYTVDSISNIGCEGTANASAEVNAFDTARVTMIGVGDYCTGDAPTIELELEGTAPWSIIYSIAGVDQPPITANTSPAIIPATEEGIYQLVAASDANCNAELVGTVTVTEFTPPTADLSGDLTLCEGETGLLNLALTGDAPFVISYAIDGVAQDNDTIFFPTGDWEVELAGTYTILSVEDLNCVGVGVGTSIVTVLPIPTASISGGDSVCVNQELELLVELTGTPDFDVEVYLDGALFDTYTTSNDSLFFTATTPGEYTVFQITDIQCSSAGLDTTTLSNYLLPEITSTSDSLMCFGDTLTLGGFATAGFGGPYSYQWVIGNDTIATDSIDVIIDQPQAYQFLVDDGCGIEFPQLTVVTVHPYPSFDTTASELLLCGGGPVMVDSEPPLSLFGDSCVWTVNGQTFNICDSVEVFLPGPGSFDLDLYVLTQEGCVIDTVVPGLVDVQETPIAGFSFTPEEPTIAEDLLTFQNLSTGATMYNWFLDSLLFSDQFNPSIDLRDSDRPFTVNICLAVENEFGCVDTTCTPIDVDGEFIVYVPDAFTPDDDKVNDSWKPSVVGVSPDDYVLRVFGRNGQIIWETTDIDERWNGQGTEDQTYYAGDSIYQWQLEVRRFGSVEKRKYSGIVTLIR